MQIHFILVEPRQPENVGASARAIKTMGFKSLRLVNPCEYLDINARKLAHGSNEILENASVYASLKEAIGDADFVIGTTAKKRTVKNDYYPAPAILKYIENKGSAISSVAMVFGREDTGLNNEELALCHLLSSVPIYQKYPSLNLAQAVMIYAYSLSPLVIKRNKPSLKVDESELNTLKKRVTSILASVDLGPDKLIYPRIMERLSTLGEDDIHLLHSITSKLINKL